MDTDILIENSLATWTMPLTQGEVLGTYSGTFQFKTYLTPLQQLSAGREYRELLGSLSIQATDTEGQLAFALVQLKHRVIKAPPFWTSTLQDSGMAGNLADLNVIALVLDAAIRSENLFKEKIQKERDAVLDRTIKVGKELLQKNEMEEAE